MSEQDWLEELYADFRGGWRVPQSSGCGIRESAWTHAPSRSRGTAPS